MRDNLLAKITWLAGFLALFFILAPAQADPLLANYFLTNIPTDAPSIAKLARYQVLIIEPWEASLHRDALAAIKQINPRIIILAYVPSKSYDTGWTRYPASLVYNDLKIDDAWWLKDSAGKITSDWPGHQSVNLAPGYADYFTDYLKTKVFTNSVFDGIFWDVVYDGISFQNGGDIDLNNDGIPDEKTALDAEWNRRVAYLLAVSRAKLGVKYVVFNGTSAPALQNLVNGRMYENFPTPWEAGGSWSGLMTKLNQNKMVNQKPSLYIFNANTNNTGDTTDLRAMRFGLGSSLLLDDIYFSYDYGTSNHGQIWYYDEYNAKIGLPVGAAVSLSGVAPFASDDVWRRDFEHGLVLVNSTNAPKTVDLGGDFETINSSIDNKLNNGVITDQIELPAFDSTIMFKTFKTLTNAVFTNGSFARFYSATGVRERNGFFVFEDGATGGAKIFNGDLNGDNKPEKIVVTRGRLEIFNDAGARLYNDYPFGANLKGALNIVVGQLGKTSFSSIVVTLSAGGGQVLVFNYQGRIIKNDLYPLGKKYLGGFSPAIGDKQLFLGVGKNSPAEVLTIVPDTGQITKRFYPYGKTYKGGVNITAGNFIGDSNSEIATVSLSDKKPVARVFTSTGKKLSEFTVSGFFGRQTVSLATVDLNFNGKMSIAALSGN